MTKKELLKVIEALDINCLDSIKIKYVTSNGDNAEINIES